LTRREIAAKLKLSEETVKEYLNKLKKKGKIRHVGGRKTGYWEILK